MDECKLRAQVGQEGIACDREQCVFWRLKDHLDVADVPASEGCALQHFEVLGSSGRDLAEWLVTVKERVERLEQTKK